MARASRMAPDPNPTPAQPTSTGNSMAPHVKAIAIIDLVFAGLTFLVALGVLFAFGFGAAAVDWSEQYGTPDFVADMLSAMAFVLTVVFVAVGVLYLMAGLRLLSFRRSSKGLGIASAVVQILVGLPTLFGGGIGIIPLAGGIYGLVILLRSDTDRLLANP